MSWKIRLVIARIIRNCAQFSLPSIHFFNSILLFYSGFIFSASKSGIAKRRKKENGNWERLSWIAYFAAFHSVRYSAASVMDYCGRGGVGCGWGLRVWLIPARHTSLHQYDVAVGARQDVMALDGWQMTLGSWVLLLKKKWSCTLKYHVQQLSHADWRQFKTQLNVGTVANTVQWLIYAIVGLHRWSLISCFR